MTCKNEPQHPDNQSGFLSPEVTEALKKHRPQMTKFEIYNEVVLRDNARLRASPNYSNAGPWFDYANVSWEKLTDGVVETYLLPAKCLCFFRSECKETAVEEIMALIHSVDQFSEGKIADRADTLLTRNYRMEYDKKGKPVTHVVPVASIDSAIRCFAHSPSKGLFSCHSPGVTYLLPQNHWAYMWMALNDALQETNSIEKTRQRGGKLNALCSSQWLEQVREMYMSYLNATCIDDIGNPGRK